MLPDRQGFSVPVMVRYKHSITSIGVNDYRQYDYNDIIEYIVSDHYNYSIEII